MKKYIVSITLFLIIVVASFLRLYKLGFVAPGISWDEASVGYNAYTMLHWGRDEWGRVLPVTFKSFEDYKNPVHIYATALSVGLLGLDEFAVRLPAALFGILSVLIIFLLGSALFDSRLAGLLGSFVLAISPYNIQFSRFNHELNFAVFFFSLGVYLFLRALDKRPKLLLLSFLLLGIDLLTYQSAKIVTPPLVLLLIVLSFGKLIKTKKCFLSGLLIYLFFISILFIKPELLGGARLKQNTIRQGFVENTYLFKRTNNEKLGILNVVYDRYLTYFGKDFLFERGDPIPRHSAQVVGTFYKMDALFLVIGLVFLVLELIFKRRVIFLFILAWGLLAPLPAAASSEFTHAARSMFITVSWHLVIAYGIYKIISIVKFDRLKYLVGFGIVLGMMPFLYKYLNYYYGEFATRYGTEWQYGMREIVRYVEENPQYYAVYMTDAHSQPYIFYLFYLRTPLPEFLSTVKYNNTISRPSNLVTGFGRYKFGMWDQIESYPNPSILYVLNPSKYDGLRFRDQFKIVKRVKYPNGTDAFFLVTGI